jgi:hypothetical protein
VPLIFPVYKLSSSSSDAPLSFESEGIMRRAMVGIIEAPEGSKLRTAVGTSATLQVPRPDRGENVILSAREAVKAGQTGRYGLAYRPND